MEIQVFVTEKFTSSLCFSYCVSGTGVPWVRHETVDFGCQEVVSMVLIWLSGNALVSINVVTLHRARLVPGWVTILGRVNHLGTEPGTRVNQLEPSLCG